jgi:hypothetical protein
MVLETLSQKKKKSQKRTGGVAQGLGPEFKPKYCQKKKKGTSPIKIYQLKIKVPYTFMISSFPGVS